MGERNRSKIGHAWSAAAIAATVFTALVLAGCSQNAASDSLLRIVGEGSAVPSAESTMRPPASPSSSPAAKVAWTSSVLSADAAAPLPHLTASNVNAVLLARREAHALALEKIAKQIAGLPARRDRKVAEILHDDAALRQAVENVMRQNSRIDKGQLVKGKYAVRVVLPLEQVATTMGEAMGEAPARRQIFGATAESDDSRPRELPATKKEAQRMAFEAAVADARARLLEAVKQQQIDNGRTLGALMEENPELSRFVIERVQNAPVAAKTHPLPADCRVVLEFDMDRLVRRIHARF